MNILYVVRYPMNEIFSIKQKIDGQIKGFQNLGNTVSYLCYDENNVYLNENGNCSILGRTLFGKSKLYLHLFSYVDLYKYCLSVIKNNSYSLIYIRSAPLNRYAYQLFKVASSKSKIVVENPSYSKVGTEKSQSILRSIYGIYSGALKKKISKYVDLYVLIGEKDDRFLMRPAININNAVSLNGVNIKKDITPTDGKIHILALASMSEWHGYDRLIRGIAQMKEEDRRQYVVDMVGDEGDGSLTKWKELSNKLALQDVVQFHGRKSGDELSYFFDIAKIGVSSLGFYRTGFTTGSVLKLREYMARGIPFIYAHDDPDIDECMDWCLKIPNDSTPVNMENVSMFIERIEKIPNLSERMRTYAKTEMTWEAQLQKVFEELDKCKKS